MLTSAADIAERRPDRPEPDAMLIDLAERRSDPAEHDGMPTPAADIENAAPTAAAQDSC